MSFDPPSDFTKDVSFPNRNNHVQSRSNQNTFRSPLLPPPAATQFDRNSSNLQNKPNYNQSNYNGTVYSRLGQRNQYNHHSDNTNNNNRNDDNRNFNRKRMGDINQGPQMTKRKWRNTNNRQPFYQNSTNTAQNRLNRIRNHNYQQVDQSQPSHINNLNIKQELDSLNDSQDLDATDIVVEVINHQAPPSEETSLARFKMVLDPKTQAAIKVIQAKRKEKQVIFPYAVTPNVTEISLHDRFTML